MERCRGLEPRPTRLEGGMCILTPAARRYRPQEPNPHPPALQAGDPAMRSDRRRPGGSRTRDRFPGYKPGALTVELLARGHPRCRTWQLPLYQNGLVTG